MAEEAEGEGSVLGELRGVGEGNGGRVRVVGVCVLVYARAYPWRAACTTLLCWDLASQRDWSSRLVLSQDATDT